MKTLLYVFVAVMLTVGNGFAPSHGSQAPAIDPSPSYAQTVPLAGAQASVMAVVEDKAIRPFRINIPKEAVVDLRRRIAATRWPAQETVTDQSQGVQLAKIQALVRCPGVSSARRR